MLETGTQIAYFIFFLYVKIILFWSVTCTREYSFTAITDWAILFTHI